MEKDNFKDRPIESTKYNCIYINQTVYICEKHAQKYACKKEHLTRGVVVEKLTRHDHPRGIKVKILDSNGEEKVGRVVYTVD